MFKNFLFFTFYMFFLAIIFLFFFPTFSFAAYPKLVATIVSAFEEIKSWIITVSTPAVAVAVRYRCIYEKV